MPDQSRKVASLVDPRTGLKTVSMPDPTALTKFVDPHIEQMQQQVFKGYNSLNEVIDAQSQAKSSDYRMRMQKAQYESQNGSSGLAPALGALGSTLIQGYSAYTETQNKKAAIEAEMQRQKLDEEQKLKAEQMKAYYEEAGANMLRGIDDTVTKGESYIRDYGWEKGTTMAQTELDQIMNSPQYSALPPDKRTELVKYYRAQWGDVQKKQTNYIVDQKEKIKAGEIDKTRTFIKMSFGGQLIGEVRNGTNPDEAIQRFYEGIEGWKAQQQDANNGKPLDPNLITEVLNPVYKEFAEALQARYGDDIKNYSESYKYVQLEQYNATLEQAVGAGLPDDEGQPMTESRAKALVKARAIELGIPGYSDSLELSNDKITKRQITKLEQAKALESLLNDNSSAVNPDTVVGQKAVAASQGSLIFGSINGDAGSKSMLAHIKNNRDKYPVYLQNLPEQIAEFTTDRKQYQEIQQKLIKLEGDSFAMSAKTNPETLGQRSVLVPPNDVMGTGGGYQNVSGSPSPTALAGEREALLKEMDLLKSQQVEIQTKWTGLGLDITNPGNRTYLDGLEADTAGVLTEAQTRYAAAETSKTGGVVQVVAPSGDREVRLRAVNNASRKQRNEKWDSEGNLRSQQSLNFIQNTQKSIISNTGDKALGEFVGTGMLQQNRLMDEYEALLSSGISASEASRRVKAEYSSRVDSVYNNQKNGFKNDYKPGTVTPAEWKKSLNSNFSQKVDKFAQTYNWYSKEFASQRQTIPPSTPNPSQSRQQMGEAVYSNSTVSPTKGRSVGQPSMMSDSAFARYNGHFLPVRGSARAGYALDPGNGGTSAPGLRIKSTSDQPMSVQGGVVAHVGTTKDGQYVVVKTPDGRYEGFQRLASSYWRKGDKIRPGQTVGKTGAGVQPNYSPLGAANVSSPMGMRGHPVTGGQKMHQGTDFVDPNSDDVRTLQGGTVVWSSDANDNYGTTVIVQTPDGKYEQFSHLANTRVKVGQQVGEGQLVGIEGATGRVTGKHLHMEVHTSDPIMNGVRIYDTQRENPEEYVAQLNRGERYEFTYSTWDSDPLVNGKLSSRTSDPVSYLRTQSPSVPNNNGQSGISSTGSPQSSTGIYELNPGVYLMPNGKVMDMKTGQVRDYKGEKKNRQIQYSPSGKVVETRNTGNKPQVLNSRKMSIYKEDYAAGRVKNSIDDDYGYSIMKQDPDFRKAVAALADELDIPAVWLADQMELETAGWTHVKKGNKWGYTGLIQMSPENMAHYGVSPQAIRNMSLGDQVRKVVAPYLRDRDKYQKIKTMEDLVMSIWAAPKWQRKTPAERAKLNDGLSGTSIKWYMERMGKNAGRKYNHNYDGIPQERKAMHTNPRQGCGMCQQMIGTGSFQQHFAP